MMPPGPEYPPQFSDSSISGVLGDINDFAGPEEGGGEFRSAAFAQKSATQGKAIGDTNPTPVFITGIAGPQQATHPGLRETMVASAILRFVSQLPQNDPNVKKITSGAFGLMGKGGAKIVDYAKKNSR
jgi:hypothetical protein